MSTPATQSAVLAAAPREVGMRLDLFLARRFPGRSRAFFQEQLKAGRVTLNGRPCRASDKLHQDDSLAVEWPQEKQFELKAESMALDILHEDDDILVINKPAGLVVHPAKGNWTGTLVQGLLAHVGDEMAEMVDDEMRPGIVHRLDKDTSGVLVIAKNPKALSFLQQMFHEHTVQKTYLALAAGSFTGQQLLRDSPAVLISRAAADAARAARAPKPGATPFTVISNHLGRHPRDRKKIAVVSAADGKSAITHYRVLAAGEKASLLELRILTGRTHQIRVHLAHIRHPVLGDGVYGGRQEGIPVRPARQMLHAWKLAITHPGTGAAIAFTAPIPEDFRQAADALGLALPAE